MKRLSMGLKFIPQIFLIMSFSQTITLFLPLRRQNIHSFLEKLIQAEEGTVCVSGSRSRLYNLYDNREPHTHRGTLLV